MFFLLCLSLSSFSFASPTLPNIANRYLRLAMGLFLRGTDVSQQRIKIFFCLILLFPFSLFPFPFSLFPFPFSLFPFPFSLFPFPFSLFPFPFSPLFLFNTTMGKDKYLGQQIFFDGRKIL
jgi:hypothetical protein